MMKKDDEVYDPADDSGNGVLNPISSIFST